MGRKGDETIPRVEDRDNPQKITRQVLLGERTMSEYKIPTIYLYFYGLTQITSYSKQKESTQHVHRVKDGNKRTEPLPEAPNIR